MRMLKRRRRFILVAPVFVANNFLVRGQDNGIEITPLKLQKLVYFLFKEYLKRTGSPLFSEQFETWKYGPVIPSIYAEFNSYGSDPIKSFAVDSQKKCYIVRESGVFKECLDNVWEQYAGCSGTTLSQLTHRTGTAWSKAKEKQSRYLSIEDIRSEADLLA